MVVVAAAATCPTAVSSTELCAPSGPQLETMSAATAAHRVDRMAMGARRARRMPTSTHPHQVWMPSCCNAYSVALVTNRRAKTKVTLPILARQKWHSAAHMASNSVQLETDDGDDNAAEQKCAEPKAAAPKAATPGNKE